MNISEATQWGSDQLGRFDNPKLETSILLSNVLNKDRVFLKINEDQILSESEISMFQSYIDKRAQSIPIAYIMGYKDFGNLRIKVTPDVLIPRDETETLCYKIIGDLGHNLDVSLLDIGTGSGCIPIFLSKQLKIKKSQLRIKAVDVSSKALDIARENFEAHQVKGDFIESDLLNEVPANSHFNIITANLPYVPSGLSVAKDLSYEPEIAIFSGLDGLDHIRRLESQLAEKNITFNSLWLEFLPSQKDTISIIFQAYNVKFLTDEGGDVFFVKVIPHA